MMVLCSLGACSGAEENILIPLGRVPVYDDAEGSKIIDSIICPARVVSIDWPDKTYYIVKIRLNAGHGFVTHGRFAICRDDASQCYRDQVGSVNENCSKWRMADGTWRAKE